MRRCWLDDDFSDQVVSVWVVHESFGIGQINDGRIRLLVWAVGKGLRLLNTCFQKRKSRLITFRLTETETMIKAIEVVSRM